jgi:formylglycine-generating enzyme required for sulfatase activity
MRYPFVISPDDDRIPPIDLTVPVRDEVPEGFVYVAPGRFYFGHDDDWFMTVPVHERRTSGFFIARNETTYAQWIEYLRELPPEQRPDRLPEDTALDDMAVALRIVDGEYRFEFRPSPRRPDQVIIEYPDAERVRYPRRKDRAVQRWTQLPVTALTGEAVRDYAAWLDRTGRVPGARMCREDEWERAARGADRRLFSHGDSLVPDEANYDNTYGLTRGAFGLDEVGSYPASESPFGVLDMVGNAREMTLSVLDDDMLVLRSGSYFRTSRTNKVVNRDSMQWGQKRAYAGFRLCADVPARLR